MFTKIKKYWSSCGVWVFFIILLVWVIWQVSLKAIVLTYQHGSEMYDVLINFEKVLHSVEVHQNPDLFSNIATGDYLAYLLRTKCDGCRSIPVLVDVNIEELSIQEYSETFAKVQTRTETSFVPVSPSTHEVIGPCRASATIGITYLTREDGVWKVSGGEGRGDTETLPEDLKKKLCPENTDS